jgi:predicted small metal-binding protein
MAFDEQVDESEAALPADKCALIEGPRSFDRDPAGEVEPKRRRQRLANLSPTCFPQCHTRRANMSEAKVIQCPCGYTLHGAGDAEVVAAAQEHARTIHDQELSSDQALAMARPA